VHDNGDEEEELALTTSEVAAATAVSLAMNSHAKLLLVVTDSGHTVAIAAKYKPRMPIVSLIVPRVTLTSNMTWRVKVLDSNNLSTAVPVLVRAHAVT
jgi:pyruvate kinase